MEGDPKFRECCGVYALYDFKTFEVKVDRRLFYVTQHDGDFEFGELTEDEYDEVTQWVTENIDDIELNSEELSPITEEEFEEEYSKYFK